MCVTLHSKKHAQSIPENGKSCSSESLYLPECSIKYMNENRNLDFCAADHTAGAVVVVTEAGTFRLKYTGLPSTSDVSFQHLASLQTTKVEFSQWI